MCAFIVAGVGIPLSDSKRRCLRRVRTTACAEEHHVHTQRNVQLSRRALLAIVAAAAIGIPQCHKVDALGIAPTPINPYAKRRQQKAYMQYVRKLEDTFENVPVGDLRKVVQAGGGGFNVGYRVAGAAAFVASALSTAIVHPIDSVKTRLQARLDQPLFKGLYRGVFSNILKEAPNAAIYLGVYELIKAGLMNMRVTTFFQDLPLLTFLIAGALGDAVGSIVRVPAEVVNKRLQLCLSSSWLDALYASFATPSARRSTLIAWQATLWRDVPYGGLQIMLYEFGKMLLSHAENLPPLIPHSGLPADVMVGALAGMLAAIITTPADVLVTRVAMQSSGEEGSASIGTIVRGILRDEGVSGLFSGALERGIYYAPLIGLFFALYESTRHMFADPHTITAALGAVQSNIHEGFTHGFTTVAQFASRSMPDTLSATVFLFIDQMPFVLGLLSMQG